MRSKARFIEPMLLLRIDRLPSDASRWSYELKLDGYRAVAFKTGGRVQLRSRNDHDFASRYAAVVKGLANLPADTVIDGEVVALDDDGRPSFNLLQTYSPSKTPLAYFVFDLMMLDGRDVMHEPASVRRDLLERDVLPTLAEPVRYAAPLDAPLPTLIESVKAYGFEGLVAKRLDSRYEPGLRSGDWWNRRRRARRCDCRAASRSSLLRPPERGTLRQQPAVSSGGEPPQQPLTSARSLDEALLWKEWEAIK